MRNTLHPCPPLHLPGRTPAGRASGAAADLPAALAGVPPAPAAFFMAAYDSSLQRDGDDIEWLGEPIPKARAPPEQHARRAQRPLFARRRRCPAAAAFFFITRRRPHSRLPPHHHHRATPQEEADEFYAATPHAADLPDGAASLAARAEALRAQGAAAPASAAVFHYRGAQLVDEEDGDILVRARGRGQRLRRRRRQRRRPLFVFAAAAIFVFRPLLPSRCDPVRLNKKTKNQKLHRSLWATASRWTATRRTWRARSGRTWRAWWSCSRTWRCGAGGGRRGGGARQNI